jgi:hypothetical protein
MELKKILELNELTVPAANDMFPIVDVGSSETKKIQKSNITENNFTTTLKNKLDGIEAGAKDDQTGAEIKGLYEAQANTNAFTDGEKSKLTGIDTGATDDQTGAEIKAAYEAETNTNAFTDGEKSKLTGIDTGATDDQTGAEIKAAYEAETNTNAFTDGEKSKLAGIEALADVTDAVNVAAAGALMASNNLSDVGTPVTAFNNIKQAASETATGVAELATDAETVTGTDTGRAVTPANLTAKMAAPGAIGETAPSSGKFTTMTLSERSADPADPAEGHAVVWMSDGTGSGDDGDILFKITAGAVTKTATLVDFSTL